MKNLKNARFVILLIIFFSIMVILSYPLIKIHIQNSFSNINKNINSKDANLSEINQNAQEVINQVERTPRNKLPPTIYRNLPNELSVVKKQNSPISPYALLEMFTFPILEGTAVV